MIQFFNKKMSRKRKGFTLIELIVVIAILGVLVAIAVPRLIGFTQRGENAAAEATARTLNSSTAIYEAEGGEITSGMQATTLLEALVTSDFVQTGVDLQTVTFDGTLWNPVLK